MFCGLKKSVQDLGRKKRKRKKLIAAKVVRIKGYFETYNTVKYFFAVLEPFLNEIAFYAKLWGRVLGPKAEVT